VLARDQNPAFGAGGGPGAPGEVEVSVPESEMLRNIKRAVAAGEPAPPRPSSSS